MRWFAKLCAFVRVWVLSVFFERECKRVRVPYLECIVPSLCHIVECFCGGLRSRYLSESSVMAAVLLVSVHAACCCQPSVCKLGHCPGTQSSGAASCAALCTVLHYM